MGSLKRKRVQEIEDRKNETARPMGGRGWKTPQEVSLAEETEIEALASRILEERPEMARADIALASAKNRESLFLLCLHHTFERALSLFRYPIRDLE
jgi:hypothetical protein